MSINYNLETGVKVYYDLIPYALAQGIMDFLHHTTWQIGWGDKGVYDATESNSKYFYHDFVPKIDGQMVPDEVLGMFLDCVRDSPAWTENGLDKCSISRAVANCVSLADITHKHSHNSKKALVYHANLEWKSEWGGELFFYDPAGKRVEKVYEYIPGQIIIHDGQLVHHLKPPFKNGPKFRFSFGIFFEEHKDEETMGNS